MILNHSAVLGVSDASAMHALVASNAIDENVLHGKSARSVVANSSKALAAHNILPNTIDYTQFSLNVMRSSSPIKALATLTAIEKYGETMMGALENGIALRYKGAPTLSAERYQQVVDPYFAVHRDGDISLDHQHIDRMLEMLNEVATAAEMHKVSRYARKFADKQLGCFQGMHAAMKAVEGDAPKIPFVSLAPQNHIASVASRS